MRGRGLVPNGFGGFGLPYTGIINSTGMVRPNSALFSYADNRNSMSYTLFTTKAALSYLSSDNRILNAALDVTRERQNQYKKES